MSNEKENSLRLFLDALDDYMETWDVKQYDLAERTEISPSRISEILSGKYTPGLKIQSRIAEAFGMTLPLFLMHGNAIQFGEDSEKLLKQLSSLDPDDLVLLLSVYKAEWLRNILPDLLTVDKNGQKAVKAIVEAFKTQPKSRKADEN